MKKRSSKKRKASVMRSVEASDVTGLREAIAAGAGLLDDMDDTSPLAIAIEKDNAQMATALLDLGHSPDLGGIVVPLAEAARNGNREIVELLLARGAKVNQQGEEGETAVMWAAGGGHLEIVKRLIEAGAKIKQRDSSGEDALDYALRSRSPELIDFLVSKFPRNRKEKIAHQAHLQNTPEKESPLAIKLKEAFSRPAPKGKKPKAQSLIHAYTNGRNAKVLQLLAAGADPNETNEEGTTILVMAAASPTGLEIVAPLLKAGADPNRGKLFRPLKCAAAHGAEPVRSLLKAGADVNWSDLDGRTALISAAGAGDEETVRLLLDAGADPNAEDHEGHTAYWYALSCNNKEAAQLLEPLTTDTDNARRPWRKNKEGKSKERCFIDAAKGGDFEHAKQLLSEGVRVDVADSSGDTALHYAAANGDLDMIRMLLESGAPLEAEDSGEKTPLMEAARNGEIEAVQVLLQAGADVHAKKDQILCYACEEEDCLPMVDLLLKAGAKVNVSGGFRRSTPLHVATEKDQTGVVRRLLEAGANVRTKDPNGWTPFLNAALRCRVVTVQLLIDAGSDVNAIDQEGRNAYDLASKWGKREVAELLKPLVSRSKKR